MEALSKVCHKVPQHRVEFTLSGYGDGVSLLVPGVTCLLATLGTGFAVRKLERVLAVFCLIHSRTLELGSDSYLRLGRATLAKIAGSEDARHVLRLLREAGFIEGDGSWISGEHSQGWRLTARAAALPLERYTFRTDAGAKLAGMAGERIQHAIAQHPAHKMIWGALQLATLHPGAMLIEPEPDRDAAALARRRYHWGESVRRFNEREWHFSCDRTAQRIHNNITSLPSALRRYVLLDGKPCAETDIACCQPLLMYRLYPPGSVEAVRYSGLVASGLFYEAIAEAAEYLWKDRGRLKEAVYAQVLYGPVRQYFPLWQGFGRLFPELAEIIVKKKSTGYNELAIANQQAESDIVIRSVIPRLAQELPGVPVLTVHDSLLTPEEFAGHAAKVLSDEITAAIGLTPKITIKKTAIYEKEKAIA